MACIALRGAFCDTCGYDASGSDCDCSFDQIGATCSVPVAGALLGVSRSSAYKAVENGEIPAIRVGRRIVVPTAALRRMLECGSLLHDESEG